MTRAIFRGGVGVRLVIRHLSPLTNTQKQILSQELDEVVQFRNASHTQVCV